MEELLNDIRKCKICEDLPLGPNPVVVASPLSKIILLSQAPGRIVHDLSKPWADKSGETLREWLGVGEESFYNPSHFAIVPMGFCYPGKGKSGDLPPKKICAPTWHPQLMAQLNQVKLILLIGKYAQDYYLPKSKATLTENVRNFQSFLPQFFPLPHPSPRNNIWQARNPWFTKEVLPTLRQFVADLL